MKMGLLIPVLAAFLQLTACSKPYVVVSAQQPVTPPVDTVVVVPPVIPPSVSSAKTYLALGDSYTIGQSIPAAQSYPNQTVGILHDSGVYFNAAEIIATTGWTTRNLLDAIANKPVPATPYDIVTLLIGVNNQYQGRSKTEYKIEFTELLQKSVAYAGNRASHVIVISIPDYSVTTYGKSTGQSAYIATQIDSFNLINKQVTDSFNIRYLNVTDESRKADNDPSLLAADGLHYSAKEYAIWSNLLAPLIDSIVK